MSLLSKLESLYTKVVAVLIPLEIKRHTVPHFKGLNSGLEPQTRHWDGINFIGPMPSQKVFILLHTGANERFVLLPFVNKVILRGQNIPVK